MHFEVIVQENVDASAVVISHDFCLDGNGEAMLTISDGSGPFTVNWQSADRSESGIETLTDLGCITIAGLNGGLTFCGRSLTVEGLI